MSPRKYQEIIEALKLADEDFLKGEYAMAYARYGIVQKMATQYPYLQLNCRSRKFQCQFYSQVLTEQSSNNVSMLIKEIEKEIAKILNDAAIPKKEEILENLKRMRSELVSVEVAIADRKFDEKKYSDAFNLYRQIHLMSEQNQFKKLYYRCKMLQCQHFAHALTWNKLIGKILTLASDINNAIATDRINKKDYKEMLKTIELMRSQLTDKKTRNDYIKLCAQEAMEKVIEDEFSDYTNIMEVSTDEFDFEANYLSKLFEDLINLKIKDSLTANLAEVIGDSYHNAAENVDETQDKKRFLQLANQYYAKSIAAWRNLKSTNGEIILVRQLDVLGDLYAIEKGKAKANILASIHTILASDALDSSLNAVTDKDAKRKLSKKIEKHHMLFEQILSQLTPDLFECIDIFLNRDDTLPSINRGWQIYIDELLKSPTVKRRIGADMYAAPKVASVTPSERKNTPTSSVMFLVIDEEPVEMAQKRGNK